MGSRFKTNKVCSLVKKMAIMGRPAQWLFGMLLILLAINVTGQECDGNKACIPISKCELATKLQENINAATGNDFLKTLLEKQLTDLACGDTSQNLVCCGNTFTFLLAQLKKAYSFL